MLRRGHEKLAKAILRMRENICKYYLMRDVYVNKKHELLCVYMSVLVHGGQKPVSSVFLSGSSPYYHIEGVSDHLIHRLENGRGRKRFTKSHVLSRTDLSDYRHLSPCSAF